MSMQCDVCGKKPQVGNNVSHANNKSKRVFKPNLQKVRVQMQGGGVMKLSVCTRCLRSGAIAKPLAKKAS